VASWTDNENFVAVSPNCVGLNALYFNAAIPGGQSGELLHNALLFLAGGAAADVPWVSEAPVTGTVAAGTDLDVDVIFTALPPYNVVGESYTATLLISHNDPVFPDDIRIPITMTVVDCVPVYGADFGWAPLSPFAGDTVAFTGTASGEAPITYTWDFGDGGTGTGANVSHVYAAAGTYTVTMVAANACPSEDSVAYVLTVVEPPCVPVEIEGVGGGVDGCVVDLFAVVTGTEPFAYLWDFAAFGTYTTAGVTVDFGVSGSYPYTLTVSNCGGDDVFAETLVVTCTPSCDDVQIVTYTTDIAGCAVDFAVEVTGTAPFTYLWEFGDGMTSTAAMPTHTYTQTGTYAVTAHVYNCTAGHDLETFDVVVDCGGPMMYYIYLPIVAK
jgi:PKD repeat protein